MPQHRIRIAARGTIAGLCAVMIVAGGCSSNPIDVGPPTIEPAQAAQSPPTTTPAVGDILALSGAPQSAAMDGGSLVVFTPGDPTATLTVFGHTGAPRVVRLPGPATAVALDGQGTAYAATRGGFFTVDLASGSSTRTPVDGADDTDFTAITRRSDGRLVLGSADGRAYTLAADNATVAKKVDIFARVDSLVAQGDTAVVLDRAQTSVTALDTDGSAGLALRAGLGATGIAADQTGRVVVADSRGGQLLVFSVDPLIKRQAYPVDGAPYGIAGSATLVWVSLPATNTVVGYDLATGIPVEKVRYPTVQQPNTLAFDDATGTLYVVSGSGHGVQVIHNAGGAR